MRSKILQYVFITWFIISSVFLYNVRIVSANPIVLAPEIYYAIASAMAGSGLYASDDTAVESNVQTYWQQCNETRKHQWAMITAAGMTVGKIMIDGTLMTDVVNYLDDNYNAGANTVTDYPVNPNYTGTENISITFGNNAIVTTEYREKHWEADAGYFMGIYVFQIYNTVNGTCISNPSGQFRWDYPPTIAYLGSQVFQITHYWISGIDEGKPYYDTFTIPNFTGDVVTGTAVDYGYTGDPAGFGSAVDRNGGTMSVPVPKETEVPWPDSWIDDLEKSLNEADNPTIDDETKIDEGEEDWDWYVDKDTGELYKVPKGTPPRHPGDRNVTFMPPTPEQEPNIPPEAPDVDNPDVSTTTHPPEVTTVNNPDGTTTTTTTQRTDKTERWWNPDKKRWVERKSTRTTKRTVTTQPDGTIISDTTETTSTPPTMTESDPEKDQDRINWEPLRRGLGEATNKFPFSLPWDLYRSIKQLESSEWDGIFEIDIDSKLPPGGIHFDIDLRMFEELVQIAKKVELFLFDISLILITRKLMGGDV